MGQRFNSRWLRRRRYWRLLYRQFCCEPELRRSGPAEQAPSGGSSAPPPPTCDQLLAEDIDSYLQNYKGMTGSGSPLLSGLSTWGTPGTDAGTFLVNLGETTGVDPAFIL